MACMSLKSIILIHVSLLLGEVKARNEGLLYVCDIRHQATLPRAIPEFSEQGYAEINFCYNIFFFLSILRGRHDHNVAPLIILLL